MKVVNKYVEKILARFSAGPYLDELMKAKQDYFQRVGRVAEASEKFESHMSNFLDWYIFDRPLTREQISPAWVFFRDLERAPNVSEDERQIYRDITQNSHSIFEFIKQKRGDLYVRDLFDKEIYLVEDSDTNEGFREGDLFETRLIKFRDQLVFGTSFVFHPPVCKKFIVKAIRAIQGMGPEARMKLIHKYAVLRLKSEQYPHVEVKDIYSEALTFEAG